MLPGEGEGGAADAEAGGAERGGAGGQRRTAGQDVVDQQEMADAVALQLHAPARIEAESVGYISGFGCAPQAGLRLRVAAAAEQGRLDRQVEGGCDAAGDGFRLVVTPFPTPQRMKRYGDDGLDVPELPASLELFSQQLSHPATQVRSAAVFDGIDDLAGIALLAEEEQRGGRFGLEAARQPFECSVLDNIPLVSQRQFIPAVRAQVLLTGRQHAAAHDTFAREKQVPQPPEARQKSRYERSAHIAHLENLSQDTELLRFLQKLENWRITICPGILLMSRP